MPRIPVRVEPYSSPTKQHRHYKSKRDQVLRALGKAAYINGSQFALLLVSARGDVETYASEALQNRLDPWFVQSGIAQEARELARGTRAKGAKPAPVTDHEDMLHDRMDDFSHESTSSMKMPDDPFVDTWGAMGAGKTSEDQSWSHMLNKDAVTEDSAVAYERASMSDICSPQLPQAPRMSTPMHPSAKLTSMPPQRPTPPVPHVKHTIELKDEAARTAFLELRFSQLQQVMCKMIAKEWIKVIEPKKQTRFPYNKGEAGRPGWWPAGVRHKEPDHLMKPERHALLLAILRSTQTRVARLQLATAEVVALIKAGKVCYLMDIYHVGKEEERLRDEGLDNNTPITLEVTSLEGWDTHTDAPGPSVDLNLHDRESRHLHRGGVRTDDEEAADMSVSTAWTPTGADPFSPRPSMTAELPHADLSLQAHDLNMNMRMSAMDVPPGSMGHSPFSQAPELPVLSPASMRPEPARSQAVHTTSGLQFPMVTSPATQETPLPMGYAGSGQDMQRSASLSAGATSVPMRPTRSTPAHLPNTPDHWQLRPSQHSMPSIHVDGHMAEPSLSLEGQRMPMMMHPTFEGYHRPSAPAAWGLPETPVQRPPTAVPMGLGIHMPSASDDVRFSSSFDSSYASSHQGPMTPAQMPTSMGVPPGHAYPGMAAPAGSTPFHGSGITLAALPTKQGAQAEIPFHPSEWQTH
ncbi:hypothetical protein MCAP1_001761 [Malassezia caprae]|uniref:MADS-box domain-containing protein n=1 Tax=Malassezia caprae TaxID=1381934 RepID=A0AAF0E735_9BASI|nr:hypothetical protein MCAP1_001761 [Malassezia caprae]